LTFDERLAKITSLYKEGAKGNASAVQEANQLSERLRHEYPDHPLAEAYHGSIMLLIARDKSNPLERLKWAKNGLKLLDKAVAATPNDSRIRYLRGRSSYRLPEKYFQRTQTVIEDYTFLIDRESLQEGILKDNDYARITYELGEAYRRIGRNEDAAKSWTKLEQQTQDPEFRLLLKQKLQSLEGKPSVEQIQSNESLTSILIGKAAHAAGKTLLKFVGQGITGNKKEEATKQEAAGKRHKRDSVRKKADRRKRLRSRHSSRHKKRMRH
jgi:tetratricopeptide (TPR) repeat protein